jgi:hypothetical protein
VLRCPYDHAMVLCRPASSAPPVRHRHAEAGALQPEMRRLPGLTVVSPMATLGRQSGPTAITEYVFGLGTSMLRLSLEDGTDFITQIGTVRGGRCAARSSGSEPADRSGARPHRFAGHPGKRKAACQRLIDLARSRDIILLLSGAHVVETAKKGGGRAGRPRMASDLRRRCVPSGRFELPTPALGERCSIP